MDWNNYDPREHAKHLIDKRGSCGAPSAKACNNCFTKRYGISCRKDTAYDVAKKFLGEDKIKSIW